MKTIALIMMSFFCINLANADVRHLALDRVGFHTPALLTNTDSLRDSDSNITIENTSTTQTFNITGVFIQQLFQADLTGHCADSYFDDHGRLYGTMWSDVITFAPPSPTPTSISLGAGYLYSMMMNYLYEAAHNGGPAATTPGGVVGTRSWCIQLGILQGSAGETNQAVTSLVDTNTSPSASLSNVVTWTDNTHPTPIAITCNDSTQECTANSAATQEFPY